MGTGLDGNNWKVLSGRDDLILTRVNLQHLQPLLDLYILEAHLFSYVGSKRLRHPSLGKGQTRRWVWGQKKRMEGGIQCEFIQILFNVKGTYSKKYYAHFSSNGFSALPWIRFQIGLSETTSVFPNTSNLAPTTLNWPTLMWIRLKSSNMTRHWKIWRLNLQRRDLLCVRNIKCVLSSLALNNFF